MKLWEFRPPLEPTDMTLNTALFSVPVVGVDACICNAEEISATLTLTSIKARRFYFPKLTTLGANFAYVGTWATEIVFDEPFTCAGTFSITPS